MSEWVIKQSRFSRGSYNAWHIPCENLGFIPSKIPTEWRCANCRLVLPEDILTQLRLIDDWWTIGV